MHRKVYMTFSQMRNTARKDPNAGTNVKIPDSQKKFDFYDVWILVGKDDALHD